MPGLAEVKQALDEKLSIVDTLRKEHDELKGDYVSKDAYSKLEKLVTDASTKFTELESEYKKELKEAKDIAEEACLKAGRRGTATLLEAKQEDLDHKTAFDHFIRNRNDPQAITDVKAAEKKSVTTTSNADGGYAVPTLISTNIQDKTADESVMENLVTSVVIGTPKYSELIDKGGLGYGWVGEDDARPATGTPGLYSVTPPMGIIYAYPQVTEVSLEDMFFDVEKWLTDAALTAFANAYDTETISGNGSDKPLGMLNTAPVATADGARADKIYQYLASGAAAGIGDGDALVNLIYTLKKKYRKNSSWLMNSMTTSKVRVLKDGDGRFLWADGLAVGQPDRLLGYGVNEVEAMPDIAANSTPIGFGDHKKAYTMVKGFDLRVTRDEITAPGFVKFHIRKRLGGAPTNDDATKFLKCEA